MPTIIELEVLIGILYLSAARRDSNLPVMKMWSDQTGAALYQSAISANRFKFLLRHLTFTPEDTHENYLDDHFILFSQMWTWFIEQCQVNCEASNNLTADETIIAFKGRVHFQVYMSNKPTKYGLKLYSMCDAHK